MGELIAKAAKIAQIAVVAAIILGFLAALTTALTAIIGAFQLGDTLNSISEYLLIGREFANNFIPAKAFNACIALWFTGSSLLLSDYLVTVVGGKITGIR